MAVHILRLRRTDKSNEHVLLHVSQPKGSNDLDLKLVGTEHTRVFALDLKDAKAKSLQASNYTGDLPEWKAILKYVLLHERPEGTLPEYLEGLEAVTAISGSSLTVTLRKNIQGITQRLGSIKLTEDANEEIDALDWVDRAVASSDDLRTQLETLQASVSGQQDQVAKLTKQLHDLVQAKKEHEEELLQKFAALLNSKKLKIRDQQRLLAGAKVDPVAAEAVKGARDGTGRRKAGTSRGGKRKAKEREEPEADATSDDDAETNGYEEVQQLDETPPHSDQDATDDDDVDDLDEAVKVSKQTPGAGKKGTAMEVDQSEEPPPRRELPFARKTEAPSAPPAKIVQPAGDDDEDETDDEL